MAKRRKVRAWIFLACWTALTCFSLTFPFQIENPPKFLENGAEKIFHTTLFTVMGIAAQAAVPWTSLLVTGPLAVGLEVVQKKIPGRTYDLTDMTANIVGILLGLAAFELSTRLSK